MQRSHITTTETTGIYSDAYCKVVVWLVKWAGCRDCLNIVWAVPLLVTNYLLRIPFAQGRVKCQAVFSFVAGGVGIFDTYLFCYCLTNFWVNVSEVCRYLGRYSALFAREGQMSIPPRRV